MVGVAVGVVLAAAVGVTVGVRAGVAVADGVGCVAAIRTAVMSALVTRASPFASAERDVLS